MFAIKKFGARWAIISEGKTAGAYAGKPHTWQDGEVIISLSTSKAAAVLWLDRFAAEQAEAIEFIEETRKLRTEELAAKQAAKAAKASTQMELF